MMRRRGITKIILSIIVSFLLIKRMLGTELSGVTTVLIIFYSLVGEFTALLKEGAIPENKLDIYERNKLHRIRDYVIEQAKAKTNVDVSYIKLYVIPSDEVNAMALGFTNIAITQGTLSSCDEMTICAILSQAVAHILYLDSVFKRILFADTVFVILILMTYSFISVSMIWVLFLILVLLKICNGFLSIFITSHLSKSIKSLFEILQRGTLFLYQIGIAALGRRFEYRADSYAVDLGFGTQLVYFLKRYGRSPNGIHSFNEALYTSHSAIDSRVRKIQQKQIM